MSATQTTHELFEQAVRRKSINEIAAFIGLHNNTVRRWMEQKRTPEQYHLDFLRLLDKTIPSTARADQFYTKPVIARKCWETYKRTAAELKINLPRYHFIEPSAGCGWFYALLPPKRRTGIDIAPQTRGQHGAELQQADFLTWQPPNGKYAVVGNPPFGLRGHLALQFINHAAKFADVIGFILPQLFESDGKGAPMKRVDSRLALAKSEWLPPDSFEYPDGTPVSIRTVFQVWVKVKHDRLRRKPTHTCERYASVYSLSNGGTPSSTRNKAMLGKCDIYLPSTCYDGMRAYTRFEELPHSRGYGVVIHRNKREIKRLLQQHDWRKTAFLSTNSALNLRQSLIKQIITAGGYYD